MTDMPLTPDGLMDFSRGKPPAREQPSLSDWINARADAAALDRASTKAPWPVVSPSMLGGPCLRQVAYDYFAERALRAQYDALDEEGRKAWRDPRAKFPGRMLRLFDLGSRIEDLVADELRAAGFVLLTVDQFGKQFGFRMCPDNQGWARLRGRIDGVITQAPACTIQTPCLWECKSMNAKKFKLLQTKGVAISHPHYYAQMQMYMGYMQLTAHPAMFTAYCKDDSSYHFEFVPYNAARAQEVSDQAVAILKAEAPEDIARGGTSVLAPPCSWCAHKDRCWEPAPPPAALDAAECVIARPSWL